MSASKQTTVTGLEAIAQVLDAGEVSHSHTTLGDLHRDAGNLFSALRSGKPRVIVINVQPSEPMDIQSIRWIFPAGIPPLVLCPSTPNECAELAGVAAAAAKLIAGPVFLFIEESVAAKEASIETPESPTLSIQSPAPVDVANLTDAEAELVSLNARLSAPLSGWQAATLDRCPEEMGKPEWLVVSYGSTCAPAAEATAMAREEGQRVNHLNLRTIWPFPEAEIMRATMGIKHTVMAERNLGQYAREIRALLPDMAVVPAGRATGDVPAALILERLQTTPRCC